MLNISYLNRFSGIVLSSIFLFLSFVWVLPHTIALRNILLVLGFIFAISYLASRANTLQFNKTLVPLLLLMALFIWVIIHFLFFSMSPDLELKEIRSLWLRAGSGVISAVALAFIVKESFWRKIGFFAALSFTPLINLGVYGYQSYLKGSIIIPNDYVTRFLFNKIEAAFFGSIAIAIFLGWSFGYLRKEQNFKNFSIELTLFMACFLFLVSSLVSASKNGVAVGLSLFALFCCCLLLLALFRFGSRLRYLIVMVIFIGAFATFAKLHKSSASSGWETLYADIKVAIQIDKNQHWRGHEMGLPLNEYQISVVGNTYERISWAVVGWSLIKQEPLGYGSINHSFKGMLDYQNITHNVPGQTHSGWTDFALAFGVPGLLIIIFSQLMIIYFGLKRRKNWDLVAVWICLALLPLGVIAEICYKQYFEATLFFIAFAATLVCDTNIKESVNNSKGNYAQQ
jgi:hypothetical protein